jgi:hypothetical protein
VFLALGRNLLIEMEDLTGRWQNLSLTNKEEQSVVLESKDDAEGSILVASFLTPRFINMDFVLRALTPLWQVGRDLKARDMGNNKALFIFKNEVDADRVIVTGSWPFDKHLIILTRLDANIPFS